MVLAAAPLFGQHAQHTRMSTPSRSQPPLYRTGPPRVQPAVQQSRSPKLPRR